jgi:hypothetical protein
MNADKVVGVGLDIQIGNSCLPLFPISRFRIVPGISNVKVHWTGDSIPRITTREKPKERVLATSYETTSSSPRLGVEIHRKPNRTNDGIRRHSATSDTPLIRYQSWGSRGLAVAHREGNVKGALVGHFAGGGREE